MSGEWVTWHCSECNITLPASRASDECVGCKLKAENAKLRDLLRWRDTAKELPTQDGPYLVMSTSSEFPIVNYWHSELSDWTVGPWQYWRPLGPVVGDEL